MIWIDKTKCKLKANVNKSKMMVFELSEIGVVDFNSSYR